MTKVQSLETDRLMSAIRVCWNNSADPTKCRASIWMMLTRDKALADAAMAVLLAAELQGLRFNYIGPEKAMAAQPQRAKPDLGAMAEWRSKVAAKVAQRDQIREERLWAEFKRIDQTLWGDVQWCELAQIAASHEREATIARRILMLRRVDDTSVKVRDAIKPAELAAVIKTSTTSVLGGGNLPDWGKND